MENQPTPAPPGATPEIPATEPPAEGKAHGLARAAEHSHRSDVAALRQWINHPDLRNSLTVPDLTGEHKGRGFERAVAAYQKAIAATAPAPPAQTVPNPAPVTDPAPATDPTPATDPPAATDPTPATDPPAATDPTPATDPPAATDPTPATETAPVMSPDASAAGNV